MSLSERLLAILEAVTARLIPGGDDGLGAREAGTARYIARALAEAYVEYAEQYARGLAALDDEAMGRHGSGFVELEPAQQDAILTDVEQREDPEARFFDLVLRHTVEGTFGDPRWGGNADLVGWRLLDYPGPRSSWSAADQQLEVLVARSGDG